ncbi:MAG: hypothetical protein RLZZ612_822 [Pseudomonadota bacterium]
MKSLTNYKPSLSLGDWHGITAFFLNPSFLWLAHKWRPSIASWAYGLVLVLLTGVSQHASALEFFNKGKCPWPAEVLNNPDLVIEYRLQWGGKRCDEVRVKVDPYSPVKLPFYGTFVHPLHPTQAFQRMFENEKYYGPKIRAMEENRFFEPMAGLFREYKIRGKKSVPPIDGHEALEYTVELLYDNLAWMDVPGIYPEGIVPICERNTVKLYVVKTDLGWYTVIHIGVATQAPAYERGTDWYRKKPKKEAEKLIARDLAIAKQCPDTLN